MLTSPFVHFTSGSSLQLTLTTTNTEVQQLILSSCIIFEYSNSSNMTLFLFPSQNHDDFSTRFLYSPSKRQRWKGKAWQTEFISYALSRHGYPLCFATYSLLFKTMYVKATWQSMYKTYVQLNYWQEEWVFMFDLVLG